MREEEAQHFPRRIRSSRIGVVRRHEIVFGLCHRAEQRPQDHRMVAGGNADPDVPVGDLGLLRHDADVGHQRHRETGNADGHAVDRGYDRLHDE